MKLRNYSVSEKAYIWQMVLPIPAILPIGHVLSDAERDRHTYSASDPGQLGDIRREQQGPQTIMRRTMTRTRSAVGSSSLPIG